MKEIQLEKLKQISPTDDKPLDDFVELAFDNLFRIFKVHCDNEKNLRYRIKENIIGYMEACGYRRIVLDD